MNLFKFLKQRLNTFPDIKPGELKNDVTKIDEVQRCANMTDTGCPGSGNSDLNQLMYPFLKKRKKVKK